MRSNNSSESESRFAPPEIAVRDGRRLAYYIFHMVYLTKKKREGREDRMSFRFDPEDRERDEDGPPRAGTDDDTAHH